MNAPGRSASLARSAKGTGAPVPWQSQVPAAFAADVDPAKAEFMADSQVPWGVKALNGTITEPAWKTRPSWYLVAADDRMIPPPAQRLMAERADTTAIEVSAVTQ